MLIRCIQYLVALGEDGFDEQKSKYSLTQHLANNLIDMYIIAVEEQLPSASQLCQQGLPHVQNGSRLSVPLITNVKVAKMLTGALVRKMPLDVSSVDSKTS